jgi:hypothetical protein
MRKLLMALLTFGGLVWPSYAASVSIVDVPLTAGALTLNVHPPDATLAVTGPDFSLFAVTGFFGVVLPSCECLPGELFKAGVNMSFAPGGTVTYAGVTTIISDSPTPGFAHASWTGTADPFLMPPLGDPFTVTEPFALTMSVTIPNCPACGGTVIHAFGDGLVTFGFRQNADGTAWLLTSGVYTIVSEPGAWLWLVAGAVGLGGFMRNRVWSGRA